MQFIHRSVGEPAEGSLTRYPYVNQRESFSTLPSAENERAMYCRGVERDLFFLLKTVSLYLLFMCNWKIHIDAVSLLKIHLAQSSPFIEWLCRELYYNLFHLFC
jgi:hypothetical protein